MGRSATSARAGAVALAATVALLVGSGFTIGEPADAGTWAVPSPDTSLDPLLNLTEFENRVVVRVNKARKKAGLKPVRYFDSCTDGFSERWARHLADTGDLVHRDQRKILRRCDLNWVGEALVRGTALTPGGAVRAWLKSPEHRAVLMKPRANRAGIGVRIDGLGRFVGVLNFGDTR
jgi:uncharacterized protein YkwD